ncbi:MAG: winged helix-turn-helix transcriptional regulator [Bacillota bacterium]
MRVYKLNCALDVIGGKWKVIILCHLRETKKRTSELRKLMPEISQRMLTQKIRELEEDGIVIRKVYSQIPPKVDYSLSEYENVGLSGQLDHDYAVEGIERFLNELV